MEPDVSNAPVLSSRGSSNGCSVTAPLDLDALEARAKDADPRSNVWIARGDLFALIERLRLAEAVCEAAYVNGNTNVAAALAAWRAARGADDG